MASDFPWYDSHWLADFVRACRFVETHFPERLTAFKAAFEVFKTRPDFKATLLADFIEPDTLQQIRQAVSSLRPGELELHEIRSFGRWVVHDHPILTKLQHSMTAKVEEIAGEELEMCYNFLSLYTKMGRCPVHLDTPQAKWTLDICVDQSAPWPIYFSQVCEWPTDPKVWGESWEEQVKNDPNLCFEERVLTPGGAVLFSGSSQWHYRDPLPGGKAFCSLLFFHFIPKGTSEILRPENWEGMFELPGLTSCLLVAQKSQVRLR